MPKRRQQRTNAARKTKGVKRSRKGQKLRGLTKQEAVARTQKGWKTRWMKHGGRKQAAKPTFVRPRKFRAEEEGRPIPSERTLREMGIEPEGGEAPLRGPRGREAELQARQMEEAGLGGGGFRHATHKAPESVDQFRESLREEAAHYAKTGTFANEDFAREFFGKANEQEIGAFVEDIRQEKRWAQQVANVEKGLKGEMEAKMEGPATARASGLKQNLMQGPAKADRNKLYDSILKRLRSDLSIEDPMAKLAEQPERPTFRKEEGVKEGQAARLVPRFYKLSRRKGGPTKEITEEEFQKLPSHLRRKEIPTGQEHISVGSGGRTFKKLPTEHPTTKPPGFTKGAVAAGAFGGPSLLTARDNQGKRIIDDAELRETAQMITLARTAKNPVNRRVAEKRAERSINRLMTKLDQVHEQRTEQALITDLTKKFTAEAAKQKEIPAIIDPRMRGRTTVEEFYKGEGVAPRERTLGPIVVGGGLRHGTKAELAQAKLKARAIKKGEYIALFDEKGQPMPVRSSKQNRPGMKLEGPLGAKRGVLPNKQWVYVLNPREEKHTEMGAEGKPVKSFEQIVGQQTIRTVPHWDTHTSFQTATRDMQGRRKYGEEDEIRGVRSERAFKNRFPVLLGERAPLEKAPEKLPRHIAKEIYVEREGLTKPRPEVLKGRSSETFTRYFYKDPSGQRTEISQKEYRTTAKDRRDTVQTNKNIVIWHMPKGSLDLVEGQKDLIGMNLGPYIPFKTIGPTPGSRTEKVMKYGIIEPAHIRQRMHQEQVEQAMEGIRYLRKPSKLDQVEEGLMKLRPEIGDRLQTDKAFRQEIITETRKRHPVEHDEAEGLVKTLAAATLATGIYQSRARAETILPQKLDTALGKGFEKATGHRGLWKKFNMAAVPHKKALTEPIQMRIRDIPFKFTHPISDPMGRVRPGGIIPRSVYLREHFIRGENKQVRRLDVSRFEAQRFSDASRATLGGYEKGGLRGWWARNRAEPLMRFKHENDVFDSAAFRSKQIVEASQLGKTKVEIRDAAGHLVEKPDLTPKMVEAAHRTVGQVGRLEKLDATREGRLAQLKAQGIHTSTFPRGSRWMHGNFTTGEKWGLGGVAVAGTALGAAYLYHRHQEKKREELGLETKSFYNKVLPRPFKSPIPTPSIHKTEYVHVGQSGLKDFLMISGNKIPTAAQIDFHRKTIKLRPEDRGYPSKAPVGVPKIRRGPKRGPVVVSDTEIDRYILKGPRTRGKEIEPSGRILTVRGKQTPVWIDIGKTEKLHLDKVNPRKLTDKDREAIVARFAGTPQEDSIRLFYSQGKRDKILDMLDNEAVVRDIQARTGIPPAQGISTAMSRRHIPGGRLVPEYTFDPQRGAIQTEGGIIPMKTGKKTKLREPAETVSGKREALRPTRYPPLGRRAPAPGKRFTPDEIEEMAPFGGSGRTADIGVERAFRSTAEGSSKFEEKASNVRKRNEEAQRRRRKNQ